jgi:hypothetical protein
VVVEVERRGSFVLGRKFRNITGIYISWGVALPQSRKSELSPDVVRLEAESPLPWSPSSSSLWTISILTYPFAALQFSLYVALGKNLLEM